MADNTPADSTLVDQIQSETTQADATVQADDPEDPHTGGIDPRTAQAKLQHAQTTTATATGAGFEFTPEEIELQLQRCSEQVHELNDDLRLAQTALEQVHEPAPDDASRTQATAVYNMLVNTMNVIRADIAYLTDWQKRLSAAKQNYMTTDHVSEQQWVKLTQGLGR